MRLPRLLPALLVCCLPAFSSTNAAPQERELDNAAALRGRTIFLRLCASCHGREAKGDGPLAKDLKVHPANLTELSKRNGGTFPYEMVIDTIENGRSVRGHGSEDMPAWGRSLKAMEGSEAEAKSRVEELAQYLWSIQPKSDP